MVNGESADESDFTDMLIAGLVRAQLERTLTKKSGNHPILRP